VSAVQAAERQEAFAPLFDAFRSAPAFGPAPLAEARRAAFDRFRAAGFPTTREEEWKFTNVAPIAATSFARAARTGVPRVEIAPFAFDASVADEVLVVNGAVNRPGWSAPGVSVSTLAEAAASSRTDTIGALDLNGLARGGGVFVDLNTAFFEDGVVIDVAPRTVVETPVHVLFVTKGAAPAMASPRLLVRVGEGAEVTIVESYASVGGGATFTNAVSEYRLGDRAVVHHVKIQREQASAFHIASTFVSSGRGANFASRSISLGGRIARNDITSVLAGEGAECTLNGLYIAQGESLVDNHTMIDHAKAHCPSHEVYKGILGGRARSVFNGKIVVRPDAQKTNAKQTNKALLLSDDATINTKPQLEIFADDVKCTHGAAIGQLDDDALFYLRARGISAHEARNMMIHAFAGEILDGITVPAVRARIEDAMNAELGLAG
jgi:Fe-S cluster assembly protein SufD